MDEMTSRISRVRGLLPQFKSALQSFTDSSAKFRIVHTVDPTNPISTPPKTLYILDSSFNPPTIAHLALATSAVTIPAPNDTPPFRILLLFSTHNADKAPSPASFVQRIALMSLFAEDLTKELHEKHNIKELSIDVGLIKEPYYADKSEAISQAEPPVYPSSPTHVHLAGYDTLIRFCNPKYYPKHSPPLSALAPFFDAGHKLRITQRPYNADDASSKEFGTIEDQHIYLQTLRDGELEKEGFRSSWGDQIDMVAASEGVGVSSTRIRRSAKDGQWQEVGRLCTPSVAEWIKNEGLYAEDASGKKMMG